MHYAFSKTDIQIETHFIKSISEGTRKTLDKYEDVYWPNHGYYLAFLMDENENLQDAVNHITYFF
jgi:hypothetical protein